MAGTLFHLSYERNVHAYAEPIEHTGNLKTLDERP